ncbi:carboxypeptidase-like regulatory domain-containing protein [Puia sp. P3]|uniref:carboxypeptidase-like regulatory domain-containing protein n=1 Tax=Puia sp. P3 TaxID=3423952 RepID=UPI003D664ACF
MRKLLTLSLALVFCASTVLAQTRSITGKVTDEKGEPIPFASILIKGHRQGVSADQNGNFLTRGQRGRNGRHLRRRLLSQRVQDRQREHHQYDPFPQPGSHRRSSGYSPRHQTVKEHPPLRRPADHRR